MGALSRRDRLPRRRRRALVTSRCALFPFEALTAPPLFSFPFCAFSRCAPVDTRRNLKNTKETWLCFWGMCAHGACCERVGPVFSSGSPLVSCAFCPFGAPLPNRRAATQARKKKIEIKIVSPRVCYFSVVKKREGGATHGLVSAWSIGRPCEKLEHHGVV